MEKKLNLSILLTDADANAPIWKYGAKVGPILAKSASRTAQTTDKENVGIIQIMSIIKTFFYYNECLLFIFKQKIYRNLNKRELKFNSN